MADRVHVLSEQQVINHDQELRLLRLRSRVLDVAVVLAALGGGFTCASVLLLFLGELRETGAAKMLFILFGGAILLTMVSLGAFVVEMLLTARGVRNTVDRQATRPVASAKDSD